MALPSPFYLFNFDQIHHRDCQCFITRGPLRISLHSTSMPRLETTTTTTTKLGYSTNFGSFQHFLWSLNYICMINTNNLKCVESSHNHVWKKTARYRLWLELFIFLCRWVTCGKTYGFVSKHAAYTIGHQYCYQQYIAISSILLLAVDSYFINTNISSR